MVTILSLARGGLIVQQTRISMDLALTWTRMLHTQLEMIRVTAVATERWPWQPAMQVLQVLHRIQDRSRIYKRIHLVENLGPLDNKDPR